MYTAELLCIRQATDEVMCRHYSALQRKVKLTTYVACHGQFLSLLMEEADIKVVSDPKVSWSDKSANLTRLLESSQVGKMLFSFANVLVAIQKFETDVDAALS